jgi:PST family polysaccharide transporter
MSFGQIGLSSITLFLLAALVGPEAFGTIALALVLVMFLQLLLQQGMGAAIVQRQDLQREHLDAAFWMVMSLSFVLVLAGSLIAPWWAAINNAPVLRDVVWVMLALLPIRGLIVTQDAVLRRDMRFKTLAVRSNLGVAIGGVAGVIAALAGAGVWALVIQQLIMATTELVVLWSASSFRPRMRFSAGHGRDLLGFSTGSFASSLGLFVSRRSDELAMGIFFGTRALGLYRLAHRVMTMAVDIVARALQPVALSELSRLQDQRERFAHRVTATISLAVTLTYPAMAILAAAAPALTRLLGPEWEGATVPLQLLCIEGIAIGTTFLVGPILQALGRPHHQAILVWVTAVISAAFYFGAGYLLRNAATDRQVLGLTLVNVALFAVLTAIVNLIVICRVTGLGFGRIRHAVAAPAGASLGALATGMLASSWLGSSTGPFVQLAVTGAIAAATAALVLLALSPKVRSATRQLRARQPQLAVETMLELT